MYFVIGTIHTAGLIESESFKAICWKRSTLSVISIASSPLSLSSYRQPVLLLTEKKDQEQGGEDVGIVDGEGTETE
jgi:hypothetical protein